MKVGIITSQNYWNKSLIPKIMKYLTEDSIYYIEESNLNTAIIAEAENFKIPLLKTPHWYLPKIIDVLHALISGEDFRGLIWKIIWLFADNRGNDVSNLYIWNNFGKSWAYKTLPGWLKVKAGKTYLNKEGIPK